MSRKLAPQSSLENLKREAKRWLKALRSNDAAARARLERALANPPANPTLRAVQHALAREHGFAGWMELATGAAAIAAARADPHAEADAHAARVVRFLTNACPDHRIRGGWAHAVARETAARLLEHHPGIARESIYTAVVCGELALVQRMLDEHPERAREKLGPKGSYGGAGQEFVVDPAAPVEPRWEPLLYLCFTRLSMSTANESALEIARLLLDHGADPNAFFKAGDSRYTPLTGLFGEGEEARTPHPRRDELVRLLIERGADPYDVQVFYNIHFHGRVLWYLELIHEHTTRLGRASDWADPEWRMIDMGGYGHGARYILDIAVSHDDVELATWALDHNANPNAMLPASSRLKRGTLHEEALQRGHLRVAEALLRYGARASGSPVSIEQQFPAAALRLDRAEMARLVATEPALRSSTKAIFAAAEHDRVDVVSALLDVGVSVEVQDHDGQRPLHVAAYANALRVAQLLIERGAEIDPVERQWSNTPIDSAIYADHPRMIALLAPYSRDVWSLTFTGQLERLRELFAEDPRRARVSWNGWTLLMRLPGDEARALEVAELLLAYGADPASRNDKGFTAVEYAEKRGLPSVVALLNASISAESEPR